MRVVPRRQPISVSTKREGQVINAGIPDRRVDYGESYEGEYVVTPKAFQTQVLETDGKRMYDNVTVKEIPYAEVPNRFGVTIVIANEGK